MSRKINRTIGILITDDQLRSSSKYFTYVTCYALLARITQREKNDQNFLPFEYLMSWRNEDVYVGNLKVPRLKSH